MSHQRMYSVIPNGEVIPNGGVILRLLSSKTESNNYFQNRVHISLRTFEPFRYYPALLYSYILSWVMELQCSKEAIIRYL